MKVNSKDFTFLSSSTGYNIYYKDRYIYGETFTDEPIGRACNVNQRKFTMIAKKKMNEIYLKCLKMNYVITAPYTTIQKIQEEEG